MTVAGALVVVESLQKSAAGVREGDKYTQLASACPVLLVLGQSVATLCPLCVFPEMPLDVGGRIEGCGDSVHPGKAGVDSVPWVELVSGEESDMGGIAGARQVGQEVEKPHSHLRMQLKTT